MDVEDRVVLTTPEGVTLDLVLAGLGSRFAAALLDTALRFAVLIAVGITFGTVGDAVSSGWWTATGVILVFLVTFGYDVLFEVLARGRTLGKRWCGIRVVDRNGGPVGFVTSVVRNLVRVVDILPGFYLVGSIALIATTKNQRLGDLAAGTYVIRERRTAVPAAWVVPDVGGVVATWDVTQVTGDEVATVRRFLERRSQLLTPARERLASDLAGRLRPKVSGPPEGIGDEAFLEHVVAAKSR